MVAQHPHQPVHSTPESLLHWVTVEVTGLWSGCSARRLAHSCPAACKLVDAKTVPSGHVRLVDAALGVVLEPYAAALQRRARVHDGVQQRRGQPGQQASVPRPAHNTRGWFRKSGVYGSSPILKLCTISCLITSQPSATPRSLSSRFGRLHCSRMSSAAGAPQSKGLPDVTDRRSRMQ